MLYKYFTEDELKCKCGCGKSDMNQWFMDKVDKLREAVDKPFIVTSAYRCPKYNDEVSSTGLNGPHTTGRAIDIQSDSRLKFDILQDLLISYGPDYRITRIGIGKAFIHIDDLREKDGFSEDVIWTY